MWIIIILAVIIISLIVALLVVYLDLRSTVEIMKNTIIFQNERYTTCLEGWEKSNKLANNVISLNDRVIELNKQLFAKLYDKEEDNNNER